MKLFDRKVTSQSYNYSLKFQANIYSIIYNYLFIKQISQFVKDITERKFRKWRINQILWKSIHDLWILKFK